MKTLEVKDWLYQKIAKEQHAPRVWSGDICAVFGETEKAYHVIMGSVSYFVITWIPKSAVIEKEADHPNAETRFCETYEEAVEWIDWLKDCYI